jgi:hypothetical protein
MAWSDEPRDWSPIPDHLHWSIRHYVDHGRVPGDFLQGILTNELDKTVDSCASDLFAQVPAILGFLRMHLPQMCWGTGARVADWELYGGLKGLAQISDYGTRGDRFP